MGSRAASFNLTCRDRNVHEVALRYPAMYISQDFASLSASWTETYPEQTPFDTTVVTPFLFHPQPKPVEQPAAKKQVMATKYSVRVALFSGVATEAVGSEDLLNKLKFVLLERAKGALAMIGGAWSPELDGNGSSVSPIAVVSAPFCHFVSNVFLRARSTEKY